VLDCLCGEHTNYGLSLTKPLGKYVLYGTSKNLDGVSKNYLSLVKNWWQLDKISPLKLYEENRSLCGFNLYNLLHNEPVNSRIYISNIFTKLFELYQNGKIKPVIDSIFSFENAHLAYAQLQERKNIGKVLLDPYYDIKEARKKNQLNKKSTDDYDDENSSDTDGPDEINDSTNNPDDLL
jgi:NADPH:quinone reductase-like Zn-dependent oxidoreductase